MASCTVIKEPIERTIIVGERRLVQVTLDEDEAATLGVILDRIGGDTERSPRRHAQSIRTAVNPHIPRGQRRATVAAMATGAIGFDNYLVPADDEEVPF